MATSAARAQVPDAPGKCVVGCRIDEYGNRICDQPCAGPGGGSDANVKPFSLVRIKLGLKAGPPWSIETRAGSASDGLGTAGLDGEVAVGAPYLMFDLGGAISMSRFTPPGQDLTHSMGFEGFVGLSTSPLRLLRGARHELRPDVGLELVYGTCSACGDFGSSAGWGLRFKVGFDLYLGRRTDGGVSFDVLATSLRLGDQTTPAEALAPTVMLRIALVIRNRKLRGW